MPYAKIRCRHCGDYFRPYPHGVEAFINDRLDWQYIRESWTNLMRWEIENHCHYCREVVFGKEARPTINICSICGARTSALYCPYCGKPMEIGTKLFCKLKRSRENGGPCRGHLGANCFGAIVQLWGSGGKHVKSAE